jgi:hypothetical protein
VGKQEDSGATVGKASIARLQLDRYRRIAKLSQVSAHAVHPSARAVRDVLDDDPVGGAKLVEDADGFGPKAASSTVHACALASDAGVAAWKPGGDDTGAPELGSSDVLDALEALRSGPMFREDLSSCLIFFYLPDCGSMARPFQAGFDAAYACE